MRIKNLFIFLFIITSGISNGQEVQNIIEYKKLNDLLNRKEYFKLNNELIRNGRKLTEDRKLYYKVFVDVAFGEREIANQSITTIFQKYRNSLNDTTVLKLLDIQASNYLYLYQYKKATNVYEYILTNHAELLDSSGVKNYMNVKNLFGTFANTAPQKMSKQKDVLLNSHRNNFNHLMTPVRIGATNEDFIFDTGANLSTISESQANKMKLRVFEQSVDIGSSTQRKVQSKLAVADSMFVGDILFENVLFLVMPDDQLTFPEINYVIKGIIGFPVINQLGEVHLKHDGKLFVPKIISSNTKQNMFFEGLNPVVQVFSKRDTLLFTFDTGASQSELSFKYYNERKLAVEKKGKKQINQRGGAGGQVLVNEYILKKFPITIGNHRTRLRKIPVTLEEYDFNKYFDGNLGQDIFMKFNRLIINFEHMYIDFK
jgi:predicted aspartyl protease